MSNIDRFNQTDSPSLSVGEFRSGTGRARQTPGKNDVQVEEQDKSVFDLFLNSHQRLNDRVTFY